MNKTINTHIESANIVELFEDLLEKYDITVPSPEDDERAEDGSAARLYGTTYYDLLDRVEASIVELLKTHTPDVRLIIGRY